MILIFKQLILYEQIKQVLKLQNLYIKKMVIHLPRLGYKSFVVNNPESVPSFSFTQTITRSTEHTEHYK